MLSRGRWFDPESFHRFFFFFPFSTHLYQRYTFLAPPPLPSIAELLLLQKLKRKVCMKSTFSIASICIVLVNRWVDSSVCWERPHCSHVIIFYTHDFSFPFCFSVLTILSSLYHFYSPNIRMRYAVQLCISDRRCNVVVLVRNLSLVCTSPFLGHYLAIPSQQDTL